MSPRADDPPAGGLRQLLGQLRAKEGMVFVAKALGLLLLLGLISSNVTVDSKIHDSMMRLKAIIRRVAPGKSEGSQSKVVIVRLDDEAWALSKETNRSVSAPFPREVLARLIQATGEAKPAAVVLDIALEEERPGGGDEKLIEAIRTNGTVVLAQDIETSASGILRARPLGKSFANLAAAGPSFFKDDEDRLIRRVPLFVGSGRASQPTLPLLVASMVSGRKPDRLPETVPMRFPAPPSTFFPSFSAAALLRWKEVGTNVAGFFAGAIRPANTVVVIGPFHAASHDHFPVPAWLGDSYGQMRGAHLLGYAIHTLCGSRWPWQAPAWIGYGLMSLFFGWGFMAVCIQAQWPKGGSLNWRSLFPLAYGLFAMGLTLWPGWFLPVTLPVAGYGAGRTVGELFCAKFGPQPSSPPPETGSPTTPSSEPSSTS